jgi:H+/Cl- antiporter ClcA
VFVFSDQDHLAAAVAAAVTGFVFIMTLFVLFFVPETKGVPIEELNEVIVHRHWFWKNVVGSAPAYEDEPVKVADVA